MTNKFKDMLSGFAECLCLTIDDFGGLGVLLLGIICIVHFIKLWAIPLFVVLFIINIPNYDLDEDDNDGGDIYFDN